MKVNVKVAKNLLEKVTDKAGVALNHAGMEVLSERINEQIGESLFNQKYLYYNLYKKIEKNDTGDGSKIGLNAKYLHKLAQFIGFDDYFHFENFSSHGSLTRSETNEDPHSLVVWCSKKKYQVWDIWRNPEQGILSLKNSQIVFSNDTRQIEISQILESKLVAMGGDGEAYWVEMKYGDHDKPQVLFFANASDPKPRLRLGPVSPLVDLLQKITD